MKPISIFHNYINAFIGQNTKSEKPHFLLAITNYIAYHGRYLKLLALCVVLLLAMPVFSLKEGTIPGDSFDYLDLGRNIALNKQYIASSDSHLFQTSYSRVPLLSILFATSFMVFGPSISSALIITKAAYFFSVIFIYLIAKKLFNLRTGLVTVSLVSISYYMVGFPAQLEIDQVSVLFILVSMYLLLAAFDGNNLGISIIAGVMLGLSFLTKEIAILWLPLPLYLFLNISKWRHKQNFINLISYTISFAVVSGIWWVYFYLTTGEIFLFSDRTSLGKYLLNAWGPLTISLSLLIILFLIFYLIRKRIKYFPTKPSDIYSSKNVIVNNLLTKVSPWLLWILFTALFSISLSRMATWLNSIGEIPLRITGFKYWAIIRILPEQPFLYHLLFPAIIIITLYLLFKRNLGDLVLFWYLLIIFPQLLTLAIEGQFVQPARYGMWLFWIGYLIIARCIVLLIDFISNSFRLPELNKLLISNFMVIPIIGYGLWVGNMIPPTYNYQKYQSPSYHNAKPIQETSTWIINNIPKDARLGSSVHYLSALNFYLEGQYEIYRWYALRNDHSNREWPFNREIELAINQGELVFQDRIRKTILPDILYLQHSITTSVVQYGQDFRTYYSTISRQALIDYIEDLKIDYLVLSEFSGHGNMLNVISDYFLDNPAFQIVFSTDWKEGFNIFRIYIIKIDRTFLLDSDYPITITTDVWPTLIANTKNILGETYDLSKLVNSLGSRPIVFKPESRENFYNYLQIAEAFIDLGKVDLAAYEYLLALNNSPDQVDRLEIIATKLKSEYPDEAGPWLLIGDINRIREDYASAIIAYNYALSKPRSSNFTVSAIHFGLGRVYSVLGESKQAIDNFIDGINITYFGRNEAQNTILLNKGAYYLSIGEFDRALDFYYQAYTSIDNENQESSDFRTVVDLISQFDKAYVTTSQDNNVHPTVFIINGQPRQALFAHPSSSVKYQIQLPTNAFLSFTPVLAPSVWKIGKGDGVQFDIHLTDEAGEHFKLYSRYIDPKNIFDHRSIEEQMVKLSPWGGQSVELEFITSPGPNDNIEFDWAAWSDLRLTQPISFNFLDNFPNSRIENYIPNSVQPGTLVINGDGRSIIFQHPPSRVQYNLLLPHNSSLYFGIGMDPSVWSSEKGDGMTFKIFIQKTDELDTLYQIFQKYVDPKNFLADRRWFDYMLNLDEFGGHEVNIIFDTHPGPMDNSNFDWGGWSMPVLVVGE